MNTGIKVGMGIVALATVLAGGFAYAANAGPWTADGAARPLSLPASTLPCPDRVEEASSGTLGTASAASDGGAQALLPPVASITSAAVLCSYPSELDWKSGETREGPVRRRELSSRTTAETVSTLRALPTGKHTGACGIVADNAVSSYLLGLSADGKAWWVAAYTDVNRCDTARVGQAEIRAYVGDAFTELADSGTWKPKMVKVLQQD